MSKIIISVDMIYTEGGGDTVALQKVVDADNRDITNIFVTYCDNNKFNISSKSDIESAAVPFVKEYETLLP